jgi:serine/arginine repetitive matrix protein 1
MFRQARAGAADTLDRQAALLLPLARDLDLCHLPGRRRLVAAATRTGTIDETVVVAQSAALFLQTGVVAGGRGDTVQTTVIETDPLPAVIHRAHVLPEETEGDKDPTRPRHQHAEIGAREDIRCRGHDPSPGLAPVVK